MFFKQRFKEMKDKPFEILSPHRSTGFITTSQFQFFLNLSCNKTWKSDFEEVQVLLVMMRIPDSGFDWK